MIRHRTRRGEGHRDDGDGDTTLFPDEGILLASGAVLFKTGIYFSRSLLVYRPYGPDNQASSLGRSKEASLNFGRTAQRILNNIYKKTRSPFQRSSSHSVQPSPHSEIEMPVYETNWKE
jgi:hypothetical protein